jgi:hypothetical protein
VASTLALVAGTVAITAALRSGAPAPNQTTDPPRTSTHATTPASSPGQLTSPGQPAGPSSSATTPLGQSISFTSSPPSPALAGGTYTVTAVGGGSGNPVTFTIDPSSTTSACSISGATVTFGQPGTCVIDANQADTGTYQTAPQAQQAFTVYSPPVVVR